MHYTPTAKWLHWVVAILIVANWTLGLTMVDIHDITPTKIKYLNWHKWIGVTVFSLVCVRMVWRRRYPAPAFPVSMSALQRHAATATHFFLYALMIVMPITGYLESTAAGFQVVYLGLVPLPVFFAKDPSLRELFRGMHEAFAWMMAAAFVVHVVASLKHHFVDRDDILLRMLPHARRTG